MDTNLPNPNGIPTNPGTFLDLSRKIDQILLLLQGSTQLNTTQEPIVPMLQYMRGQLSLSSNGVPNHLIDKLNNLPSGNEINQMLTSNNQRLPEPITPLQVNLDSIGYDLLQTNPPWTPLETDVRSTLIHNQQNCNDHNWSVQPPVSVSDPQVVNLLNEIKSRIGGNSNDEPIANSINRLHQTVGVLQSGGSNNLNDINRQLAQIQNQNISNLRDSIRDALVPSISDTLIQTSNSLISTIRNDVQNILGKYTDVNQALNGLKNTISQSDPNTLARRTDVETQFNQLSNKVQQYGQMLQQLHDTTSQLIGQSNDNSRLIYGIGNKLQGIDRLTESINNANNLLQQDMTIHRTDIDQLVRENLALRSNLQTLVDTLNSAITQQPQTGRINKNF